MAQLFNFSTMESITMFYDHLASPIGLIEITASSTGVQSVYFVDKIENPDNSNQWSQQCKRELQAYFSAQLQHFSVPLDQNGTDFQKQVWEALLTVEYGKTASYLEIAQKINNPKAIRAVGSANGKNPLSIIVPCHRIIGSNGTLTGYAGGLERKSWLLQHESPEQLNLS